MREILFRGRCIDSNEWSIGKLVYNNVIKVTKRIFDEFEYSHDVTHDVKIDSKTVGQYTGLKDKNGVKIFEGDIVRFEGLTKRFMVSGWESKNPWWHNDLISFEKGCFTSSIIEQENSYWGELPEKPSCVFYKDLSNGEVIGNIHENECPVESRGSVK